MNAAPDEPFRRCCQQTAARAAPNFTDGQRSGPAPALNWLMQHAPGRGSRPTVSHHHREPAPRSRVRVADVCQRRGRRRVSEGCLDCPASSAPAPFAPLRMMAQWTAPAPDLRSQCRAPVWQSAAEWTERCVSEPLSAVATAGRVSALFAARGVGACRRPPPHSRAHQARQLLRHTVRSSMRLSTGFGGIPAAAVRLAG